MSSFAKGNPFSLFFGDPFFWDPLFSFFFVFLSPAKVGSLEMQPQMLDGRVLEASQVEYKPFGKPPLQRELVPLPETLPRYPKPCPAKKPCPASETLPRYPKPCPATRNLAPLPEALSRYPKLCPATRSLARNLVRNLARNLARYPKPCRYPSQCQTGLRHASTEEVFSIGVLVKNPDFQ